MNYKHIFYPLYPVEHNGYNWGERLNLFSRIKIGIRELIFGKNIRYKFILLINLIKHIFFYIYNIAFFPLVIIIYLFNIRFIHISSWQVGSYVHQLDTIIKANRLNQNLKLILLCPNFICANNFISSLYSNHIICLKNIFIYFFLIPFVHNPIISLVPWPFETQNKNSIFNKIHNNYYKRFKKYNLKLNKKIFKKIKFKNYYKNTVCIHLRDTYYKKSNTDRNVKVKSLKKTINYLLEKKFKVIRFTNPESEKLPIKNKNYTEFLILSENDRLKQFFIMNKCRLVIGSQSGVLNYNLISKTPYLLTNAIPINNIMVIKPYDFYIFKKFYKKNKLLSISEIINYNYHINPEKLKKNVSLIDNSDDEILNATKEILNIKKFKSNKILINKYYKSINKIGAFYTNAKISKYFLNNNKKIFK